ncbi:hypothetical protein D3C78_1190110 [compost metagenome]
MATGQEGARFRGHLAWHDQHIHQQIDHQGRGDEVEHDGGDDDVAAAFCLQPGRNEGPGRAEKCSTDDGEGHRHIPGHITVERKRHQCGTQPANIGLTFGADIEQAGMESDRNGEAGEDEARRVKQREADGVATTEGAFDEQAKCRQRIFTDGPDDEAGNQKGGDDVQQRQQAVADPVWQGGGSGAHSCLMRRCRPSSGPASVLRLPPFFLQRHARRT